MSVNQKQIAEKLGVSITLVSRVLSGKAAAIGIAPHTIDRVLKTAKEMGYVPSAAALTLKGKATRTIGVAVYDFNDPFFGALIQQIQMQAHEHNYSLILAGFLNRSPDEQDLQALYKHAINGLIVIGTEPDARWLDRFDRIPVARIGHGGSREQSVRLATDEPAAAALLLDRLHATGRRRPLYIRADLIPHKLRETAFRQAAGTFGIELDAIAAAAHTPFEAGMEATRRALSDGNDADALLCATDQVAMGALHALREAGITSPEQIAVTGFDDIPTSAQFNPAVTTIRQPLREMGLRAFQAIRERTKPKEILLPGELIVRETA
jgi:LacI family transcriptional regulator